MTDDLSKTASVLSYLIPPSQLKIDFTLFRRRFVRLSLEDLSNQVHDFFLYCGLKASEGQTGARRYETMNLHVDRGNSMELQLFSVKPWSSGLSRASPIAGTQLDQDDISVGSLVLKFSDNVYTKILLDQLSQGLQELRVIYTTRHGLEGSRFFDTHLPPVDWRAFFMKSPSIRGMSLDGQDLRLVIDALLRSPTLSANHIMTDAGSITQESVDTSTSSGIEATLPLPYLQILLFGSQVLANYDETTQDYESLKRVLLLRRQCNRPISCLGFTPNRELQPLTTQMRAELLEAGGQGCSVVWGYTMAFQHGGDSEVLM